MLEAVKAEAKRLYGLGFAIHWLHPKSKRPIENAWTTGPRKRWEYLEETYIDNLNVGVRLGKPSKVGAGYLSVIDLDVKSTDKKHAKEAIEFLRTMVSNVDEMPSVNSGRGNGSMHFYCITEEPITPMLLKRSETVVKALMPSSKPTKKNTQGLTAKEIDAGYRWRPAWEVSLMGEGQQVVLPPSIHPDSKKPYLWGRHIKNAKSLPKLGDISLPAEIEDLTKDNNPPHVKKALKDHAGEKTKFVFEVQDVNLFGLPISEKIFNFITTGEGIEDRSASLLPIAKALHKAGLNQNQILTVLTDPENYIASCGYDHAETKNRARAAYWLYKYTVKKVINEQSSIFDAPLKDNKKLSVEEIEAGEETELDHWTAELDESEKGILKPTFKNCKLILENVLEDETFLDKPPAILGHNEFAGNDYFIEDTPFGNEAGKAVTDTSILDIKNWCIKRYGIEFSVNTINEVVQQLSYQNRFHPVRDYVKSLTWDGVPRVNEWLKKYAKAVAPEPYLSDISRKFLVAMIKRIFEPGCQYRQVLILEGKQEAGKSSLARALGGQWFTDAPLNIGDKDSIMAMQSNWVIELGELSALNRADSLVLKAFISQQTDRMRPPYGRRMVDYPRQSVFIGTTNDEHYFKDPTGNTRFWPVKVGDVIDFKGCEDVRDQLFAEAYELYVAGEELYLTDPVSKAQALAQQTEREMQDEWLTVIRDVVFSEKWLRGNFEIKELANQLTELGAHRMSQFDVFRITQCLKKLGFTSYREGKKPRRRLWKLAENGGVDNGMNVQDEEISFDNYKDVESF